MLKRNRLILAEAVDGKKSAVSQSQVIHQATMSGPWADLYPLYFNFSYHAASFMLTDIYSPENCRALAGYCHEEFTGESLSRV